MTQNSPLFGAEAFAAIAMGVQILVSKDSGMASLLDTMIEDEPIVGVNRLTVDAQSWKERITEKLVRLAEVQKASTGSENDFLQTRTLLRLIWIISIQLQVHYWKFS